MKTPTFLLASIFATAFSAAEEAAPLSITVELDRAHAISQDLFGANTEAMHLPVWFDEPAFAEKYKEIGSPFIRFPGGTPANFYNPVTGIFDDDSPSTREYGNQNKKLLRITDGKGLTPEPFFKFVKDHDARYSLVLNVCTQTFEQNKAWLEKLAQEGNKIPAIEIGNEVFYGGYQWAFPKSSDYVERARKLTALIRKLFPGTKVAVVFPNQFYQDENFTKKKEKPHHQYEWMKALEAEDFYDAIVIHLYSLTGMNNNTLPADFMPHQEAYGNVIAMLEKRLAPTMADLKARFPGKKLWITEYGVGGFGGNLKQYTLRYSHLGALHTDVMFLRFIADPAVTMTHWHSFNHFFDGTKDRKRFKDHEHITHTHFSIFRDPIRKSSQVAPVSFSDKNSDLEGLAFNGKDKTYLIVINKFGKEHTLKNAALLTGEKTSSAKFTAGVQVLHRSDMPLKKAMQDTDRSERVILTEAQLKSIKLAPYSITQLEITAP